MGEELSRGLTITRIEDVTISPTRPRLIRSRVDSEGDLVFYIVGMRRRVLKEEKGYTGPIPMAGDTGIRATPLGSQNKDGRYNGSFRKSLRGLWLYEILHQEFSRYEDGRPVEGEEAAMEAIRELYEKYRENGRF